MYIFFSLITTITLFCMFAIKTVAGVAAFVAIYGFITGSSEPEVPLRHPDSSSRRLNANAFSAQALLGPMLAFLSEGPAEIGCVNFYFL